MLWKDNNRHFGITTGDFRMAVYSLLSEKHGFDFRINEIREAIKKIELRQIIPHSWL